MKLAVDLTLSPLQLAEAFCELDDEAQAQFFIEAARLAASWPDASARYIQWLGVGKHLRDCECSTDDARELVRDIARGLDRESF